MINWTVRQCCNAHITSDIGSMLCAVCNDPLGDQFLVRPVRGRARSRSPLVPAGAAQPMVGPDSGSETSKAAALANFPRSGTQRYRVLEALWMNGALTREEIAVKARMGPDAVRPRVLELISGGWAEESSRTRKTAAGLDAVLVRITEKGRVALVGSEH